MSPDDFFEPQRKYLMKTIGGGWAFVPPPLPPDNIDLGELAFSLARASAAVGELKGAARRLQNPTILIKALQRREALTSSAMEGTITTLGDLVREEAAKGAQQSDDARETFNYISAIAKTGELLKKLPMSHRVIKEAHAILLSGLSSARGAGKRPGEYKIHQNAVGKRGETINTARYVPPPPQQTQTCMDELELYINREKPETALRLIDLGLVHYQFEAIHPFDDGNGRIGRMLVTLLAQQTGLLDLPLLHLSAHLEKNKDDYIENLFAVSTQGLWGNWLNFFLGAVEQSCIEATNIVDRILELQKNLRSRVHEAGKSPRLLLIVDDLFTKTWTTASETQKLCKITLPTALSDLKTLVKLGLLTEIKGRSPKLYYSPEILALSDRT